MEHLNFPGSDHVPIILRIHTRLGTRGRTKGRPWRFNAHWIRKEECEAVIREGWESAETPDYFESLFRGLEACQLGLRQWSHDIHNNPRTRIDKLKQQLSDLAMGEQTEQTRKEGEELRAKLEKVYSDDDIFWRQRSKISWAREGDRNTSFFHAAASARKSNNSIRGLFNPAGGWCEKEEEVEAIIMDYFGDLFQSSNPDMAIIDEVLEVMEARVTPEMNEQMTTPVLS